MSMGYVKLTADAGIALAAAGGGLCDLGGHDDYDFRLIVG